MQAAKPLRSGKQGGRRQQLSPLQLAATASDGRPRLHPTTKLALTQVTIIHTFSGCAKLCFIRDKMSGKDFLVDSGAAISLLPLKSAASQAVNKQAIKTWDFVNTAVKFNGGEYRCAIPDCWIRFFALFWDAGQPLFPRDSDCTLPALPGRQHRWRRGFNFLSCFSPERGPGASADCRRQCSPYSLLGYKDAAGGISTAAAAVNGGPTTNARGGTPYPHER
jgi:hypothetical protein